MATGYRPLTIGLVENLVDDMTRRQAEGLSREDVIRCLKRFVAREVLHYLVNDFGGKAT